MCLTIWTRYKREKSFLLLLGKKKVMPKFLRSCFIRRARQFHLVASWLPVQVIQKHLGLGWGKVLCGLGPLNRTKLLVALVEDLGFIVSSRLPRYLHINVSLQHRCSSKRCRLEYRRSWYLWTEYLHKPSHCPHLRRLGLPSEQ
jgi:hypothetical protein